MIDHVAYRLLGILEKIRTVCSSHEVATLVSDGELLAGRCNEAQFGNVRTFHQVKGKGHRHQGFNTGAIDFTIALRRVTIPTGEQGARDQDRKERA